MLASAQAAWDAQGQGNQSPGNILNWATEALDLTNFDLSAENVSTILSGLAGTIEGLAAGGELTNQSLLDALQGEGTLAGVIGVLGADIFAKRPSDYQNLFGQPLDGYRFVETPDGAFETVIRESDGKTVAVFDDSLLPRSLLEVAEGLIDAGGNLLFPHLNFLSDFFGWFRRQLSESDNGFDGDIAPNETNNHPLDSVPWQTGTEGTGGADSVWGREPGFIPADDQQNAGRMIRKNGRRRNSEFRSRNSEERQRYGASPSPERMTYRYRLLWQRNSGYKNQAETVF